MKRTIKSSSAYLWWVKSWLLARCPPSSSLIPTMSTGHGEKVRWKSSWVEIKPGRLLINYYHRQNRLHMGKMISPIKNGVGWCKIKTKLKSSLPQPSSQAYFTPSFPSPSSSPCDDTGNGACSQCTTVPSQLLLSPQFFPAPAMWSLPWDSPSQTVSAWALPMGYNPSGTDCSSRGPPWIIPPARSLLQRGLSRGYRAVPVAFPHSSLTAAVQHFLPSLKYIPTEVPPAPLLGSALASRGASRASCKGLCPAQGKPWSILREATPAAAPATKTSAPAPSTQS